MRLYSLYFIHNGLKVIHGHSRQLREQILRGEMLAGVAVFFPRASAGGRFLVGEGGREGGREGG